ncbi:hypothetical protein HDV04_003444 [Boothiomyces sp. JEL0838]|nr:hypothetical protein HDV04_003444 [Boothiomyces sp. JEL0838]
MSIETGRYKFNLTTADRNYVVKELSALIKSHFVNVNPIAEARRMEDNLYNSCTSRANYLDVIKNRIIRDIKSGRLTNIVGEQPVHVHTLLENIIHIEQYLVENGLKEEYVKLVEIEKVIRQRIQCE